MPIRLNHLKRELTNPVEFEMIYIICVTYGKKNKCLQSIKRLTRGNDVYTVLVDTKECNVITPNGDYFNSNLNEYFEFSGYQAGLNVLSDEGVFLAEENEIFVFNDTIFESHLQILFRLAFKHCLQIKKNRMICGLTESRFFGEIIPSCFMYFLVSSRDVRKINFLPDLATL